MNMNGYANFESQFQNQQSHAVTSQYNGTRNASVIDLESRVSSSASGTPTSFSSNNYVMQSSASAMTMPSSGGWNSCQQNHKPRLSGAGGSGLLANGHMVSPFGMTASSIGAATAAANNLSSLANVTTSLVNEPTHSPVTYSTQSNHRNQQHMMYQSANGSAFSPAVPPSNSHSTYTPNNHMPPTENRGPNTNQTAPPDQLLRLQRELERERTLRCQLQQRVIELTQRCHSQQLVEKSYEELSAKYTHAYTQLQKIGQVVERYAGLIKQLEQENRMLAAENSSLKAQENVAQDKTMLYNILMERSKKLEEENSSLVLENENYQRQYEKTVDEISNNVVQALLTQKALQEQCLQLQERLNDVERENVEYGETARQARQASSDSRLVWTYRGSRTRTHTASPSADSVRSMPAQHLYWRQGSIGSLEHQQLQPQHNTNNDSNEPSGDRIPELCGQQHQSDSASQQQFVCVETEFPANNSSPKSTRRNLDRHPSSGSLDSAYHSRGFVKHSGHDVRCQRSVSAEALRDMKVNMRRNVDLTLPTSIAAPAMSAADQSKQTVRVDVHKDSSPDSPNVSNQIVSQFNTAMTDSGVVNDPFAEDADDILSKHQSLIVGSMDDIFSTLNGDLKNEVIQEEETSADTSCRSGDDVNVPPTPPPRPRSRCLSDCSFTTESKSSHYEHHATVSNIRTNGRPSTGPPPLPPKQYKGSRRPYKPLPAEPHEPAYLEDDVDSSDKNTDSESIKQEINALTSKIANMAAASSYHK